MTRPGRVLVVGGSLGGLFAGSPLRSIGWTAPMQDHGDRRRGDTSGHPRSIGSVSSFAHSLIEAS